MAKQLQQRYRLTVNGVDVTSSIEGEISLSSTPDVVSELSFTLSGREFMIPSNTNTAGASGVSPKDVIKLLDEIVFEGGAGEEGGYNYGTLFKGTVKYIRPQYPENGLMQVAIEAVDYSYRLAINKNYRAYPSPTNDRVWARGSSIKASEIVRNIASDIGLSIGKDLNGNDDIRLAVDKVYTDLEPITQKNESDWAVLRKIGKFLNCSVWTSFNGSQSELHFVDKSFLRDSDNSSELSFFYALRTTDQRTFDIKPLGANEFPIWDINLDQDFNALTETSRTIVAFDYEKGEEINVFEAKVEEDGKFITKYFTFEIDESKTAALSPEQRKELEDISYSIAGGEGSHDIASIARFFKPAKFYSDRKSMIVDKPYYGIKLTGTIDGNINVVPRRNYVVKGVGRYGSDNLENSYYLKTITHTWGSAGFLTTLEFII